MLIDNLGIIRLGSCSGFIIYQPKSRWKARIGGVRVVEKSTITETRKQAQAEMPLL